MSDHNDLVHNAAYEWLNADKIARIIVKQNCLLIWTNRAAQRILDTKRWIDKKSETGALLTGPLLETLPPELAKLQNDDVLVHTGEKSGIDDILLIARMLPGPANQDTLYGIELRQNNQKNTAQYAGYRSYFGLTPAEDRVVQQLLSGHVVESCANNLAISMDTARSHIRQIYSKMGISSREALFHALMIFRIN